ncbi:hypothetical protein ACFWDF_34805, partial [Streptomyces diastaticus]
MLPPTTRAPPPPHWDLKIEAFLVEMLFLGSKWLVSFACFLIAWSLSFKLAGLLLKPALIVSDAL